MADQAIEVAQALLEEIEGDVHFLDEVTGNAQLVFGRLPEVGRVDGFAEGVYLGPVDNGFDQKADLALGPVNFLGDAAVASGLALEHPSPLIELGKGLSLFEVDRKPLKAGLHDGEGAVYPGVGRSGGSVWGLLVDGSGAVDLVERLFEGREVTGPGFRATGGQQDQGEKAEPTRHAMRSNPV